ncbi:MAG: hypothetical protein AAF211_17695 [Myxococcota bacterium]
MITGLLIGLAAADEVETTEPRVEVIQVERRRVFPPLRFGLRAALRSDLNVGPVLEFGALLWSSERLELEGNLAFAGQGVAVPGPQRAMNQFDVGLDLLVAVSKGFEVGPVASMSRRTFVQQGIQQERFWTPTVGGRVSVAVLHHKRWSWTTDLRVTSDLELTRLVFETQELRDLSPVQVQVGQRFNAGHGRRDRFAAEDS